MKLLRSAVCLLFVLVLGTGIHLLGQSPSFVKVIDAETNVPLVPPITNFSRPSISNGNVCFRGKSGTYEAVLHNNARSFTKLADTDTPVPEAEDTFVSFAGGPAMSFGPSFSGLRGAFAGAGSLTRGIYIGVGGPAPAKVVAVGDPVPDQAGTFQFFGNPSIWFDPATQEGDVVFTGTDDAFGTGVYRYGVGNRTGSAALADTATELPGKPGETFASFTNPVTDAGSTVFRGHSLSGAVGIYRATAAGSLEVVADTDTAIPDGSGTFSGFGGPFATDVLGAGDGNIVFRGDGGNGQKGIYARVQGSLEVVADLSTPVPGGSGTFTEFFDTPPSIDGENVAFIGISGTRAGVYARIKGDLHKVIAAGEALDGKTVNGVDMGAQALDGKFLAFRVLFVGGAEAVYLAAFDISEAAVTDLNTDGSVDFQDIAKVLRALGPCPETGSCPEDINGDGVVDTRDVLEVYANRGLVGRTRPVNDECWDAIDLGTFTRSSEGPGRISAVVPFSTEGATSSSTILLAPAAGGFSADRLGLSCDEGSGLDFHNDIWFRFQVDRRSCFSVNVSTCGTANFDTRLAAYAGNPQSCDAMEPISCNDDTPYCSTGSHLIIDWAAEPNSEYANRSDWIYVRIGSRSSTTSGSGQLLIGCAPPLSVEPSPNPDFCLPMSWSADGHYWWSDEEGSLISGESFAMGLARAGGGNTTNPPDCETPLYYRWICLSAPCTGPMSVSAGLPRAGGSATTAKEVSVAVYRADASGPTSLLSCSTDYINRFDEVSAYWGAVSGNRYLLRLGTDREDPFAPSGDLEFRVRCWNDDSCGWPYAGRCDSDNRPIPGCDDASCCTRVCQDDPYCCNIEWDSFCASKAAALCDLSQPLCTDIFSTDSCYTAHSSPGCQTTTCCETVCQTDPSCCDIDWNLDCAEKAASLCAAPACPVQSDLPCDAPSLVPGCSDSGCCGKVCDADPLCCSLEWSEPCVALAETICGL